MKNEYNGIVNVYKPAGFTSFDVVAKLRGIFGQRKIGHTGTLDPDAVGVLPVCLGNATKVVELLTDHDKEYVAELLLGVSTDTQDISGRVITPQKKEKNNSETVSENISENITKDFPIEEMLETAAERIRRIDEQTVRDMISSFIGEQDQIPPMYSALKVNGQKLYDLARKGIEVERKPRRINIHDIEIMDISLPIVKMRVHCSKGTYIRTLCNDIGEKLGCGGTMKSLERTRVGVFGADEAYTLDRIQKLKDEDRLNECVKGVDALFTDLPAMTVKESSLPKLENGNILAESDLVYINQADTNAANITPDNKESVNITRHDAVNLHECVRVYKPDGTFSALYRYEKGIKSYKPEKMFL